MRPKRKETAWQKTRKVTNQLHLWMGLLSGIVIFIVCLSGTIYTYNTEIREWAAPNLHRVQIENEKKSVDQILQGLRDEYPGDLTAITVPSDPGRSYAITMRPPNDKSKFGVTFYVNPYSGELLGTSEVKTRADEFMGYLFSLHRWLLLDRIETPLFESVDNRKLGSYITGAATILFTLGLLTGIVIWFPRKIKAWRQGLTVKFSGNWKRINHDLHNSLGLYAFVFLLLMGLTGPQWSFDWYRTGLRKALGTHQAAAPATPKTQTAEKQKSAESKPDKLDNQAIEFLPLADYLQTAQTAVPFKADARVTFPKALEEPIKVSMNRTGFFAPAAADQIAINRLNAELVSADYFKDKPFNERISGSIKALHVGNIYGQFSKLIYFIACLIATSLPVTGTMIWINKMKKPKRKKRAAKTPERVLETV